MLNNINIENINIENIQDDIMFKVLHCLTDTRSLAYFALASRRCNDMVVRVDLFRNISVPSSAGPWNRPRPIDLSLPHGFKHCHSCFMCKGIIPVPTDPGIFLHQCPHHNYAHPIWSDANIMLYRGPIDHLPHPTLYSPAQGVIHRTPKPVFGSQPLLA